MTLRKKWCRGVMVGCPSRTFYKVRYLAGACVSAGSIPSPLLALARGLGLVAGRRLWLGGGFAAGWLGLADGGGLAARLGFAEGWLASKGFAGGRWFATGCGLAGRRWF